MDRILDKLNLPEDLKKLSNKELTALAGELREIIINTVAHNGGHLASSLGVVELTLALHAVLNSPEDHILWDVGHQAYVHKLLTGRLERFHTLRQWGGLSGFPRADESPHDLFTSGHSSTSISAAVGLAKARDIQGRKNRIVAVIGDGSMTGGLAFEALNHGGQLQTDLVVVLNDNEMSISPNVGALTAYLNRLRTKPQVYRLKKTIGDIVSQIPKVGKSAIHYLEKLNDSLTYLFIPGVVFEELGFTYLGPVDGHNIALLKRTLQDAFDHGGPVLIHAITKKGKGYEPAEAEPCRFHSTTPFDRETGQPYRTPKNATYTQVFGDTMVELAKEHPQLVAITAAMPEGTGLNRFSEEFPDRFFDVGIAESHAVTMAAGLARGGMRPVVAVYSTFFQRAYDQVVHDVCLQNLPVVFCLDRAGVVGEDGPTHHGVFDIAYLRHLPNMAILAPKDEGEFRQMLRTVINHDGPAAIRYPRGEGEGLPLDREFTELPWGKGEVLATGDQVLILAIGNMVAPARQAAATLARRGIACSLVNPRFIKPLDKELLLPLARKIQRVVTVEDHVLAGGFGAAVLELLSEEGLSEVQVERIGYPDCFLPHGSTADLHRAYGLTEENIVRTVMALAAPERKIKSAK
ncbi:MAG TPA: 1-deoxy-D-xylulose-5-phosphate synthase [Firmicutes bacterium]|jgi:1-deoxy-D-xylulose-5-phosphate synthase|nr:1-deoxy-D-xylulose-5-phosphate synthase [Bacillota bacterium]